jgi:RTA1 like protein
MFKHRTWLFSTLFILGGIGIWVLVWAKTGETVGYIGRVGSAYDVTWNNYFIMQIVCLIIAPAFLSAGLYITIGNLYPLTIIPADTSAVIVGKANSLLRPIWYVAIFSTFDVAALTIQAIGGAGAAQAEQEGTNPMTSTHIMVPPPRPRAGTPSNSRKPVSQSKPWETLSSPPSQLSSGTGLVAAVG